MNQPSKWSKLRLFALLFPVFTLFCPISGCKDSQSAQSRKSAAQNIDESQRIILSSQENLAMTAGEIEAIPEGELSESQRKALAGKTVERFKSKMPPMEFEQALSDIDTMVQDLTVENEAAIQNASQKMAQVSRDLLAVSQWYTGFSEKYTEQRLKKAEEKLQKALQASRASGARDYQTASNLLLGTIKLLQARQTRVQMHEKDLDIQRRAGEVSSWLVNIRQARNRIYTAETIRPEESLASLKQKKEAVAGEITSTEKTIASLKQLQQKFEQVMNANLDKARELHQQHLEMLEESEEKSGMTKYELEQEAYQVQMGQGKANGNGVLTNIQEINLMSGFEMNRILETLAVDGKSEEGEFHFERNAEIAQTWLRTINQRLDYLNDALRRRQQSLQVIENTIKTLETAEVYNETIEETIAQNQAQRAMLIEKAAQQLDVLDNQERKYNALRVSAVEAYTETQTIFARTSGGPIGQMAQDMIEKVVKPELKNLWESDAVHYDSLASIVGLLTGIEELNEKVTAMVDGFKGMALEARNSAEDIELQPEEAPATPEGEMPTEPAGDPTPNGTGEAAADNDDGAGETGVEQPN